MVYNGLPAAEMEFKGPGWGKVEGMLPPDTGRARPGTGGSSPRSSLGTMSTCKHHSYLFRHPNPQTPIPYRSLQQASCWKNCLVLIRFMKQLKGDKEVSETAGEFCEPSCLVPQCHRSRASHKAYQEVEYVCSRDGSSNIIPLECPSLVLF